MENKKTNMLLWLIIGILLGGVLTGGVTYYLMNQKLIF